MADADAQQVMDRMPREMAMQILEHLDTRDAIKLMFAKPAWKFYAKKNYHKLKRIPVDTMSFRGRDDDTFEVVLTMGGSYDPSIPGRLVVPYENMMDYLWPFLPTTLEFYRGDTLLSPDFLDCLPDYWTDPIQRFEPFHWPYTTPETLDRFPSLRRIYCPTGPMHGSLTDMIQKMDEVEKIVLGDSNVTFDDSAIEALKPKCKGLQCLRIKTPHTTITVEALADFIQNYEFAADCTLNFDCVVGSKELLHEMISRLELYYYTRNEDVMLLVFLGGRTLQLSILMFRE